MYRTLIISIYAFFACIAHAEKAYVFSYFDTKKQSAGLCLAYSFDGYTWTSINENKPILKPMIGKDKLLRDPSICQGPDGIFHMVWTSGWHDRIIGYAESKDLIHWSKQREIPVMEDFPSARNSWAPELFYDQKEKLYYIYWASTVPDAKGIKTEGCLSENDYNHRIYYCTTKDFLTFSKTKLYYNPDFNAIDAAIVQDPVTKELLMTVKDEGLHPEKKYIVVARGKSMKKGFSKKVSAPITPKGVRCEGPAPLFLTSPLGEDGNGLLIVYYDMYSKHQFGASLSHDHGNTWEDVTSKIHMPKGMSHGTAIAVDKSVVDSLIAWDKAMDREDYLMVYHKDQDHGLHMAYSKDGYTWTAVNAEDKPVLAGDTIAMQHGIRDPHIYCYTTKPEQTVDGRRESQTSNQKPQTYYYVAMTDLHVYGQRDGFRTTKWEREEKKYGWGNNKGLVLMKSPDLIHWTRTNLDFTTLGKQDSTAVDSPAMDWTEVGCVWAPEIVYDDDSGKLMVHFTTRQGVDKNTIWYFYVNDDFNKMLSMPRLLFQAPGRKYNVIDSDIIKVGDKFHLFYVTHEHGATPAHATSDKITGPYIMDDYYYDGVKQGHEAPNCWKRLGTDKYVVMFDNFRLKPMNFGFVETTDFKTFTPIGYFDEPNCPMKRTNFEEQKHGGVTTVKARVLYNAFGVE